jgi:hypothetical protein
LFHGKFLAEIGHPASLKKISIRRDMQNEILFWRRKLYSPKPSRAAGIDN